MKNKNIFSIIYNEKIDDTKIIIEELCKNIIFIDSNISKAEFSIKNKQLTIFLIKKISKKNKSILFIKIKKIIKNSYFKFKIPSPQIILDRMSKIPLYNKNPRNLLIKSKEVFKEGDGMYAFGNKLTKLINIFENKINEIAKKMNAKNYHFPSLISSHFLDKVDYIKNNPHTLGFVTHLTEDLNKN